MICQLDGMWNKLYFNPWIFDVMLCTDFQKDQLTKRITIASFQFLIWILDGLAILSQAPAILFVKAMRLSGSQYWIQCVSLVHTNGIIWVVIALQFPTPNASLNLFDGEGWGHNLKQGFPLYILLHHISRYYNDLRHIFWRWNCFKIWD